MIHIRSTTTPQAGAPSNTEQPPARCPTQGLGASSRGPGRKRQRPSQVTARPSMRTHPRLLCGARANSSWADRGEGRSQTRPHSASRPALQDLCWQYVSRSPGSHAARRPREKQGWTPHNPTPEALTDSNSHQFQNRGEKRVCVCSVSMSVCLRAGWGEKMATQQLTIKTAQTHFFT